jgi:GT2 family glycosyltransferase
MTVAAVIVAYHKPHSLDRALAALGPADASLDVVVVNVEADPAVRRVAESRDARVVDLAGNPGYAAGVNAGVASSAADTVIFMNDDLAATRASLDALARAVHEGAAGVAVPALIDAHGAVEPSILPAFTPWRIFRDMACLPDRPVPVLSRVLRVEKWRTPAAPEPVFGAMAAIVAAPRGLLVDLPLPEAYFLYWEEVEWFWRVRETGRTVQYRPDIRVPHAGGREAVRPGRERLLARNAVRFVRRTQGPAAAAAAWLAVLAWQSRLMAVALARAAVRAPGSGGLLAARWAGLRAGVASVTEIAS